MNPFFRFPVLAPASRTVPRRGKVSSRVQVVDTRPCLPRPVILRLESQLEAHCYDQLIANPVILDIIAQPPAVRYLDGQGKPATHTFDFLAKLRDGTAVAVAVRPSTRVRKWRFDDTLALIAAQMPKSFAHKVLLFTEADVPRPTVVAHAPTTRLVERAQELGAPVIPTSTHLIIS